MPPSVDKLKEREHDVEKQREKLDRQLKRRGQTIDQLRKRQQRDREQRKKKADREKELEQAIADAKKHDLGKKRACLDDCTMWLGLKLVVVTVGAKTPWEMQVNAADRTSHADDCGDKSSQAELYYCFTHASGGVCPSGCATCAPANPPGHSTHEGVCDATFAAITKWSEGDDLPWFAWGLDLGDGGGFTEQANKLGFHAVRPYSNESWHVNLTEDPTPVLKKLKVI